MIYRRDISPSEAQEVLNLILQGLINETWGEENATYIHSFVCTKLNDTTAIEMNLPYSVLGYIPWFNPNSNSKMGSKPGNGENMWLWLDCLFNPILADAIHSQMAMTGGEYYTYLKGYISSIMMAIMTFLGDLMWLIARAVFIVLFFIILAIEIATTVPLFLILGVTFSIFSLIVGNQCDWGINIIVPYGSDTKIGFINIDMSSNDKYLKFESWIKWVYWDAFDLYIPVTSMDFNTDIQEYFDDTPADGTSQTGIGTFLTCGYSKLDEYIFDFESTYWDNPDNAPPEYIKVTLLSPAGALYNYTMKVSPFGYKSIDYWEGREDPRTGEIYSYDEVSEAFIPPNWYQGVRFNVTIDFEDDFTSNERAGQWYYKFIALADRDDAEHVEWPTNEEYAVGPYFNESGCISMEDPIQYLQFEQLSPFQGRPNELYNFSVWWADYQGDTIPEEVLLVLQLPNNSVITFEMSEVNTYQVDYSIVSDNGNVTYIEYKSSLNLSKYVENEIVLFHYYYKAFLSNGNYTTLFEIQYLDEMGRSIEDPDYLDGIETKTWFTGPQVFPFTNGKPLIKDWMIEDLTNSAELEFLGFWNPIFEESEIVFWIYCTDPDRDFNFEQEPNCYNETYPRVILTNKETNETKTLNGFTWSGYDYDIEADRYWVKTGADEIGVGAWDFELIIKDNSSKIHQLNKTDLPPLWIFGSAYEIFNTMRNSIALFGYSSMVTFMSLAGAFAASQVYGKVAFGIAAIDAAVAYVASIMAFIDDFCSQSNAGALLGLGLGLITVFITYSIGLQFSEASNIFKFEGALKGVSSIQVLDAISSIFLTASLLTLSTVQSQVMSDLFFYLSDFFGLTAYSVAMGIVVDRASFATMKSKHNINPVRKIVQYFSYAVGLLAVWSVLMALDQNGLFILYN